MTTTPSRLKLPCKTKSESKNERNIIAILDTPNKHATIDSERENSPIFFSLTQESNEDIDVLWDWHSPQTSYRRRSKKRILPTQSPKVPLKRYPSNNQNFEKLRNELKALQEELAVPDDESCLCVSPQQEEEFKKGPTSNLDVDHEPEFNCDADDDLFNDSIDEQLLQFSQKIEKEILEIDKVEEYAKNRSNSFSKNICDNSAIENLINKYSEKNLRTTKEIKKNDLINLDIRGCDELYSKTDVSKHSKISFQRTVSDGNFNKENTIQTLSGKLELHRTKSFEMSNLNGQNNTTNCLLQEIERKRLEAIAKLESKKKKENTLTCSLTKCSPEEIEKKRLQALAKLESKRLQEMVEKKRQEALKKLQLNRLKNASQVRGTLSKRF